MDLEKLSKIQTSTKKPGIYIIVNNINKNYYIGSAVNLCSRMRVHLNRLRNNYHHSIILQRAWNKYGEKNFDFLILEYCDIKDLIIKEQYYIDKLKPKYNISKTAGSTLGVKGRLESNKKKSINHAFKGKYGKNHPSSKIIYQYDYNGKFIKKWYGAAEIQRETGFDSGNIRKSIKYKWTFYGNIWSYDNHGKKWSDHPIKRDRSKTKKPIVMLSLNDEVLKRFDSIKSAYIFLGKKTGAIHHSLKDYNKITYNYKWKYEKSN